MNLKEIVTDEKLVKGLAVGAGAAGWSAFVAIYRPAMVRYVDGYLRKRNITWLDAEDIVQDVLVKLVKQMDTFRYDKERGRFRDLLGKMLTSAAIDAVRKDIADNQMKKELAEEPPMESGPSELDAWHDALFSTALQRVLEDTAISKQTRDVFRRYVIEGEDAEHVAEAFHVKTNTVYQIKNRMTARLKEEVQAIESMMPF